MRRPSNPECFLLFRLSGVDKWSAPYPMTGYPSVRDAREHARHLVASGIDQFEAGKLYDVRLVRFAVCVDAWQETGKP